MLNQDMLGNQFLLRFKTEDLCTINVVDNRKPITALGLGNKADRAVKEQIMEDLLNREPEIKAQ